MQKLLRQLTDVKSLGKSPPKISEVISREDKSLAGRKTVRSKRKVLIARRRADAYLARALLQGADLVVLNGSFAELDPDSLLRCLAEAAELSRSLLVVAHA